MENKVKKLEESDLAILRDKEVLDKLMKNSFINGHRPVQMYQQHSLQTISKLQIRDRDSLIVDLKNIKKEKEEDGE